MSRHAAIRTLFLLAVIFGSAVTLAAAQLKEAQVTQVVKDVKLSAYRRDGTAGRGQR
jgi:hypothetical protein